MHMTRSRLLWCLGILAFVTVGALAAVNVFHPGGGQEAAAAIVKTPTSTPSPTTPNTTSPSPAAEDCGSTWPTSQGEYGSNRWFTNGVKEIKEADSSEEAEAAADVWLDKVRKDPNLLTGATMYVLDKNVNATSLSRNGCATDKAVQLVTAMKLALTTAKVEPAEAPSNGYNSGVSGSNVVGARNPGITGDRKAIKISLANGKTIWVMARCGNPVTTDKPRVPPGPTDEPKCKNCKPVIKKCPPSMPHGKWPKCKDSASKGPAHNAKFPEQQKPNPLPARPDHEQPQKPKDPPKDVPEPPEKPKPTKEPRPDPTQPPETEAPEPDDPAEGCSPAPGRPCP